MQIEGVSRQECKILSNARGFLREITRDDEPGFFDIGQLYQTCTRESVVKAWYKHGVQYDGIFVMGGLMKMALIDDRPDSPTFGAVDVFEIAASAPELVRIPPGVWHGFQSLEGDLLLLHFNSHPINLGEPDEVRLPPDTPQLAYQW